MSKQIWTALGLTGHVLARKKRLLISLAFIQLIFSAAIIWGIPLIAGASTNAQRFLVAAWHLGLISVSVAVAPQVMAEWKLDGYFEELKQLPISRVVLVTIELISWVVVALPGVLFTPILAWLGLDATVSNFASALGILGIAALTYLGIGLILVLSLSLEGVQVISQILMVVAMLFTPILFPADRLPEWVGVIHSWLPFDPLNRTLLSAVTGSAYDSLTLLRVGVWCIVITAVSSIAMARRQRAARSLS